MLAPRLARTVNRSFLRLYNSNAWESVVAPAPDPIFRVQERLAADPNPKKVGLGIGAYRDEDGKPYVFKAVREAERRIDGHYDHEYPPLSGVPEFTDLGIKFALGANSKPILENRVAVCQSISGSGALKMFGQFFGETKCISKLYIPDPTWSTHFAFFQKGGTVTDTYPYLNDDRVTLNFEAIKNAIRTAPENSAFFFHVCAHNPSGVDPTHAQWDEISRLCKEYKRTVVMDAAYLGYASGSVDNDAYAIRKFIADGHNIALCLSFSKNFGVYGERAGLAAMVCQDTKQKEACLAQLKSTVRSLWSSSPLFGARVVVEVLKDPKLFHDWELECKHVSGRVQEMRKLLVENLAKCGSKKDWSHITKQIGMFSFTGLTPAQVERLAAEYSVYMVPNGRANIAGINKHNVEYVAKAIHEVTK